MPSTSSGEGPLKVVIAATGCARALRTPSPPAPSPRIVQTPVSHVRVWLSYGGALDSAVDRQGAGRSARPGARPRGARHPLPPAHLRGARRGGQPGGTGAAVARHRPRRSRGRVAAQQNGRAHVSTPI